MNKSASFFDLDTTRRVNLDKWRVPDLVAEISDTTLAIDLDEKKQLYLALGIPEYWIIDVKGRQVVAFRLVDRIFVLIGN